LIILVGLGGSPGTIGVIGETGKTGVIGTMGEIFDVTVDVLIGPGNPVGLLPIAELNKAGPFGGKIEILDPRIIGLMGELAIITLDPLGILDPLKSPPGPITETILPLLLTKGEALPIKPPANIPPPKLIVGGPLTICDVLPIADPNCILEPIEPTEAIDPLIPGLIVLPLNGLLVLKEF
jgi:hypothetical protein